MITSEFVNLIAKESGLPKKDVQNMLRILPNVVVDEVTKGNKVKISQFGTFAKKNVGDKIIYNPRTGKKEQISGYEKISFKMADAMKKLLQNNTISNNE